MNQHYFMYCDGGHEGLASTSPDYNGPIGRNFKDGLELKDIVDFKPIRGIFPVKEYLKHFIDSLNKDWRLLYEYYMAVVKGPKSFSKALAARIPGHVHKAR